MPKGKKATPGLIRRYEQLRASGWSPVPSAEACGLSKAWAYRYEADKRKAETHIAARKDYEQTPSDDLSETTEFVIAERNGDDDKTFELVDRFSIHLLPALSSLAWFLAGHRAAELNDALEGLFEGTNLAREHAEEPITETDILRAIPNMIRLDELDQPDKPYAWMPVRVVAMLERLYSHDPEVAELAGHAIDFAKAGDTTGLRELQRAIWETKQEPT